MDKMTVKEFEIRSVKLKEMAANAINKHGTSIIYYWISDYSNFVNEDKDGMWFEMIYESIFMYLSECEWRLAMHTLLNNCSCAMCKCKEQKDTYLYILKSKETGLYKIGITKNINQRNRSISSHENGICLIKTYLFKERDIAQHNEKIIHRKLSAKRVCGEWFRCDEETIINTVNKIVIENKARAQING